MKNPRLLIMAISFILIGITGIIVSTWFVGKRMSTDRAFSMMDMMMGGGMMNQQQMKDMMRRMMPGMLPTGIKPESLPERNSQGAELLIRYCTQCHELPSPYMHTAEEWPIITRRMFARMSMMSGMGGMGMMNIENPSVEEQQAIVGYLQAHSLKSIASKDIPDSGSEGANLFKEKCSQCHFLPEPKLHTIKEWPAVVERMQGNMRSMSKTVITDNEKRTITSYLINHAQK